MIPDAALQYRMAIPVDVTMIRKLEYRINRWLRDRLPVINHRDIVKNIYDELDITAGYFTILTLANLIALSGLMINSAPVIIGAMLISPLMGPILSFGFAFVTGDSLVWTKSLRKVAISVVATVLIATLASYLSPLSEVTREISARTTPNIFDLMIAFLSGTAGAAAICTKKNYLTIVPGVAIATAVIPPLSVTGFGIGNGNPTIAAGAFFLFFTNFVAIVLSTCLVFSLYGFRPTMAAEENMKKLKRRLVYLSLLLLLISVPLVYTLSRGVTEIKLKRDVEASLKRQFNQEKRSRLATFQFTELDDGGLLEIEAVVNAVEYLKDRELELAEQKVRDRLKRKVRLHVEQVKVLPQGLAEQDITLASAIVPARPTKEILQEAREGIVPLIRQVSAEAEELISPSRITDFSVAFQDKASALLLTVQIRRDYPLSVEELTWLEKFFSASLNMPVRLRVETVPFVPVLFFNPGSTALTEAMKKELEPLRDAYARNDRILISLEAVAEANLPYRERIRLANERAESLASFLSAECRIAPLQIRKTLAARAAGRPSIKILVSTLPERG
ncbi:MAG: hypothetical protein A4E70_02504 [Syntrophus sp. PtaU1.Bin005]|nr:MAG: hypothetical protein A4E70_02504 [Syntrophus sp. PtaU1.Bin005]